MLKAKTTTAIKDHMLFCNHVVSLEEFNLLVSINSKFHLKIKENISMSHDIHELRRNKKFVSLYLFY